MEPSTMCLIGLLVLIGIVLLGRIILKIAMWIIIIIVVLLIIGGGISLFYKLFGLIISPITGAFLV